MALLKLKLKEARELVGYGIFRPGEAREVPDMVAANLVKANPDMWGIETPKAVEEEKNKAFASTKKMDTKAADKKGDK